MSEDIAKVVTDWVSAAMGADVHTEYGYLGTISNSCMVRAAPGDPVERRYLSGGGVYRFPYEVYLRAVPRNAPGPRIDCLARLRSLQAVIEAGGVPDVPVAWQSHEVTQVPSLYRTEESGAEVYLLSAVLTYVERS